MDKTIGHMLRVAMVDAGMTQRQLAAATGLTERTVSRHMTDRSPVNLPQLLRYAEVLGARFVIAPATGLEPVTYRFSPQGSAA